MNKRDGQYIDEVMERRLHEKSTNVLERIEQSPGNCLAIEGQDDGLGAQLMAQLSGFAFCQHYGCRWGFTKFARFHLLSERGKAFDSNQDFLVPEANAVFETVFKAVGAANLYGEAEVRDNTTGILLSSWRTDCHILPHVFGIINEDPSRFYTPELGARLRDAWPMQRPAFYQKSRRNVAVHFRRYDVVQNGGQGRYDSDEEGQECLDKLHEAQQPGNSNIDFHIFAWHEQPQIRDKKNHTIIMHVGSEQQTLETWNSFVHADVLVIGRSSFSMAAAVFRGHDTYKLFRRDAAIGGLPKEWQSCQDALE